MADGGRRALRRRMDNWVLERDEKIARLLRDAYYDKYYDRDMYGAEDLNDYGEWVFSRKYGWVWRPYRNSISGYADWSPYRYGQWRWIPPYGWTWVNDEPWGWATYHHGRWVWDNNSWYWTPYGYHRYSRSWWHPALVIVNIIGGNVCWYPLPYNYGYYNYNSYYNSHHHGHGHWNNGNGNGGWNSNSTAALPGVKPGTPPPHTGTLPPAILPGVKPSPLTGKQLAPPLENIPPTGV